MNIPHRLLACALSLVGCISLPVLAQLSANPPIDSAPTATSAVPQPSSTAQQLYASAQQDLLQLRVLLKNGNSQSSVGSGFLIGTSNLVVTNFHVVSQIALEPDTYFGEYKDTQGKSGAIELLAVDVLHDLAIVRIARQGTGFFTVPHTPGDEQQPALESLSQGEKLYSLGNPLDLGFTISEGTYNGISARGFSDQLMFTGPVNPGMSGGPNVTADGQVAGVNVAHRRDGELVSFLVPAIYVQQLLARVSSDMTPPTDFKPIIGEQLLQHQAVMVDTLLDKPFSIKQLGPYAVPVRESDQVRCWGNSDSSAKKAYTVASINCSMEAAIFVSGDLQTGHVTMRHQYARNRKLNSLQFAQLTSKMFGGQ
ncbi:MAG TPA: serine protease, partial [Cellvibrio sp.]